MHKNTIPSEAPVLTPESEVDGLVGLEVAAVCDRLVETLFTEDVDAVAINYHRGRLLCKIISRRRRITCVSLAHTKHDTGQIQRIRPSILK